LYLALPCKNHKCNKFDAFNLRLLFGTPLYFNKRSFTQIRQLRSLLLWLVFLFGSMPLKTSYASLIIFPFIPASRLLS